MRPSPVAAPPAAVPPAHRPNEDVSALVTGKLVVASRRMGKVFTLKTSAAVDLRLLLPRRASLGGLSVRVRRLQQWFGWLADKGQRAFDVTMAPTAFAVGDWRPDRRVVAEVPGLTPTINHRSGRYIAV